MITTYADLGAGEDPGDANLVMYGQVVAPIGFRIMAYDVPASRPWSKGDDPFFVSVRGRDPVELTASWARLGRGGTVVAPLAPAPLTALYGTVTDRFGVAWVMDLEAAPAGGSAG